MSFFIVIIIIFLNNNKKYGACHQVETFGHGGTPPFKKGESGCAGDHCHNSCAYDTQCVRIMHNTTKIDLTATHNALSWVEITDESRPLLTRPSQCGLVDEGLDGSGMRCAAPIHRAVTKFHKTPDNVRGRDDNIVELMIYWNQGWDHYIKIDEDELENSSVRDGGPNGEWGVFVGSVIPNITTLKGEESVIVGKGAYAFGLANWHWGREALLTCDVRYTDDASLHAIWHDIEPDLNLKRSTLQTRVCARWKDAGETVISFNGTNFGDKERWCSEWSVFSTFYSLFPFAVSCTLTGKDVSNPIPNEEQRDLMISKFKNAYDEGKVTGPPLLRMSFHDAAVFSPPGLGLLKGGPQGCMRFEHVQGNEGNVGLHFTIDVIGPSIGCGSIVGTGYFEDCPWSVADVLQFAGAFASVQMLENYDNHRLDSILAGLRWGRPDAPMILCQGELQLNQPDHDGGHLAGFFKHGSSIEGNTDLRLIGAFDSLREYFEDRLGMEPKHWTAILGAHSVGGVRGLIQARNTRFMFDDTPNILDNKYYQRLLLAAASDFASLCPMNKKMGHAHWWGPGNKDWDSDNNHWLVLLDMDVTMAVNSTTLEFVRAYATNQELWLKAFREAFLIIGELGYANDALFQIPMKAPSKFPSKPPVKAQTPSPTKVPTPVFAYHKTKDVGYCNSTTEIEFENILTKQSCWNKCQTIKYDYAKFGNNICVCQESCPCMVDKQIFSHFILVPKLFTLPDMCKVECKNKTLRYRKKKRKNCKWVGKGKNKCNKKWKKKKIKSYWCPKTCKTCP